jgi:hypothetical protein
MLKKIISTVRGNRYVETFFRVSPGQVLPGRLEKSTS